MPRADAIIVARADVTGAIEGLRDLSSQLNAAGKAGDSAASESAKFERQLSNLLRTLDPVGAATQRYERQQDILRQAYERGRLSVDDYRKASELLKQKFDEKLASLQRGPGTLDSLITRYTGLSREAFTTVGIIGALATALGASIKAAADAEVADRRLEAVLKATGGTAGITKGQIDALAGEIQRATGVSDEHVKAAAAVLLTYTNVNQNVFPQTLKLAADLAALMGTDLTTATRQLGMALEDPEQGMGRLTRAGVVLDQETKNYIKTLWDLGKQEEAQKLLLSELEARIGGVSKAIGGGYIGQWNAFRQSLADIAEIIGGAVLPLLTDLTSKLTDQLLAVQELIGQTKSRGIKGLIDTLGDLAVGLGLARAEDVNATAAMLNLKDAADKAGSSVGKQRVEVKTLHDVVKNITPDVITLKDKTLEKAAASSAATTADKALKDIENELNIALSQHRELVTDLVDKGFDWYEISQLSIPELEKLKLQWENTDLVLARVPDHIDEILKAWPSPDEIEEAFPLPQPPLEQWWKNEWKKRGEQAVASFGEAFGVGFVAFLSGEDFSSAFSGAWGELARYASEIMGTTFRNLFAGQGSLMERLQQSGWVSPGGQFNWQMAGTVGGTMLWGYGASRGDRGMGAAGGAIAGASMGMTFGPWGAVIGAIIGGILGYLTSGQKTFGYNIALDRYGRGIVDITGVAQPEEDERLRQLRDVAQSYFAGFRSLMELLKQPLPDVSGWRFQVSGQTGETGAMWQRILAGELPRSIFSLYRPAIEAGLQQLGVAQGRIAELMGQFQAGQFQQAIQQLTEYVQALIRLRNLHDDLAKSVGELAAEWQMTMEERLLQGTQDVISQVQQGLEVMQSMTSPEQVERANQLADAIEQQGQALLQYIQAIFAEQQRAQQQAAALRASWEEQRAREQGASALAAYYQAQFSALLSQLQGAASFEQAQFYWQQLLQILQGGWQLGGQEGMGFLRQWAEQQLSIAEKIYQDILGKFAQQAQAQRQHLADVLSQLQAAMTSETGAHAEMTEAIGAERDARRELRDGLAEENIMRREAITGLADLATAAATAATAATAAAAALQALQSAAGLLPQPVREVA